TAGAPRHLLRRRTDGDGGRTPDQRQVRADPVAAARLPACRDGRFVLLAHRLTDCRSWISVRTSRRSSRDCRRLSSTSITSASPAIVAELAMRHPGVVPVDTDELRRFFEFRDFAHFVEVYLAVVGLIRTDSDVRYLTYEVARELATTQQVRYAELTCTPYTS